MSIRAYPLLKRKYTLLSLFLFTTRALAQNPQIIPVEGAGRHTVVSAQNGVAVVNINTPNAVGVSVNQYHQFNVEAQGAVLNNAPITMGNTGVTSRLAGSISANPNLSRPANLIINEVMTNNPSQLNGYLEVAGRSADVVIANPWGVFCNGCGFINTPRVSLTTGELIYDTNGGLSAFNISDGSVVISGNGLDASRVNILDIVARSINVNGPIFGRDVGITAGSNQFDYIRRHAEWISSDRKSDASFAIDASILGAMYANKIKLIATDQGVGVRMDKNMASTTEEFTLNSAGKIILNGSISSQAAHDATPHAQRVAYAPEPKVNIISTGEILNSGSLFSQGDLAITASGIGNTATGGIVASQELNLRAESLGIENAGAIRAGKSLKMSTEGHIKNVGSLNLAVGTIDSGGDIELLASRVDNNSAINARGNILVNASIVNNEVTGGDTRRWVGSSESPFSDQFSQEYIGSQRWYQFPDKYKKDSYQITWKTNQVHSGGTPTYRPQIVAGEALNMIGFNSGSNVGGILSANSINLVGKNSQATFLNIDLALQENTYKVNYDLVTRYVALGPVNYYENRLQNWRKSLISATTTSSLGASIAANHLVANGFNLINSGSPLEPSITLTSASDHSSKNPLRNIGGSLVSGIDQSADISTQNPNAYFVKNPSLKTSYLIEVNPKYLNLRGLENRAVLASLSKISPNNNQKLLGGAAYTNQVILEQFLVLTNGQMLGHLSEHQMLNALASNAIVEAGELGLVVGTEPSANQLNHLKRDIVWFVSENVGGEVVLAPQVYLSKADRSAITSGAVIEASNEASLDVQSLSSTGGSITAGSSLNIHTQGDIISIDNNILSDKLSIRSDHGGIENRRSEIVDSSHSSVTGKGSLLSSKGDLDIQVARDLTNKGASIVSGGDIKIRSGGDVILESAQSVSSSDRHKSHKEGKVTTNEDIETIESRKIGSRLNVGGKLNADVGGKFRQIGSDVLVAKDLNIKARNDIEISNSIEESHTQTNFRESGFGLGGDLYGSRHNVVLENDRNAVRSTLIVGKNLSLEAGGKIIAKGITQSVGGDEVLASNSLNFLGAENTKTITTDSSSFGLLGKGLSSAEISPANEGAPSASTQAKAGFELFHSNSKKTQNTDTTHVSSEIQVAGSFKSIVKNNAIFHSTNINAKENIEVKTGGKLQFLAASDNSRTLVTSNEESLSIASRGSATTSSDATAGKDRLSASAAASAIANAGSDNFIGFIGTQEKSNLESTRNFGGTISSGGSITLDAKTGLILQSSSIDAAGDVKLMAQDIKTTAARNMDSSEKEVVTKKAGIYQSADAKALAQASASATITGATASAQASSDASVGNGFEFGSSIQTVHSNQESVVVASIKSGNSIIQNAKNKLEIEGAQINALGDIVNRGNMISVNSVNNVENARISNAENDVRIGAYANANASTGVGAGVGVGGIQAQANAGTSATVGFEAGYTGENSVSQVSNTNAVRTVFQANRNLISSSIRESVYSGSELQAGGDVTIVGSEVSYLAANSSHKQSSNSHEANASLKVGAGVGAGAGVGLSASGSGAMAGAGIQESLSIESAYADQQYSETNNRHVVGAIDAKGSISIESTKGDLQISASQINSQHNIAIKSNGGGLRILGEDDVDARSDSKNSVGFNLALQAIEGAGGGAFGQGGAYANKNTDTAISRQSQGVGIHAGGIASLSASGDELVQGASIDAKEALSLVAKGNMNLAAGQNISESSKLGGGFGIGGAGDRSGGIASARVNSIDSGKVDHHNVDVKLTSPSIVAKANHFSQTGNVLDVNEIHANQIQVNDLSKSSSNSWNKGFSLNNGVAEGSLPKGAFERVRFGGQSPAPREPKNIYAKSEPPKIISNKDVIPAKYTPGDQSLADDDWRLTNQVIAKPLKLNNENVSLVGKGLTKDSYRSRIVVNTQPEDLVATSAAENLINKHPNTVLVNIDSEGSRQVVKGSLSNVLGASKVSVVGHGSDDPGKPSVGGYSPEQLANIVAKIAPAADIQKVSLVSCEGAACAQEVSGLLNNRGLAIQVSGLESSQKVIKSGKKMPAAGSDVDALGRKSFIIGNQEANAGAKANPVELLSVKKIKKDSAVASSNSNGLADREISRSDLPVDLDGLVEKGYSPPADESVGKYVYRLDSRTPEDIMQHGFAGSKSKDWSNKIYDDRTVFAAKTVRGVFSYGLESMLNRSGERVEKPKRTRPIFSRPDVPPPLMSKDAYLYRVKIGGYEHVEVMKDVGYKYPELGPVHDSSKPKERYFEANNVKDVLVNSVMLEHRQNAYEGSPDAHQYKVGNYARVAASHTEEVIVRGPIKPADIEFIQKLPKDLKH